MNKWQTTLIVVLVLAGLVTGAKFLLAPKKDTLVNIQAARSKGNPQARVKITEYVDFQCPGCAYGLKYLKTFFDQHPNDLYIQVRYFPLSMHRHSMISALYSECAARQGKFWELDDLMIPQQEQWAQLINPEPVFQTMAQQVGMNVSKLNSCIASDDARKVVNDEKSLGQTMGITSTPTYFVNGKMVVGVKSLQDELKTYFPGTGS